MSQLRAAALHRVITISCLLPFNTKINLAMERLSRYFNSSVRYPTSFNLHFVTVPQAEQNQTIIQMTPQWSGWSLVAGRHTQAGGGGKKASPQ